MDLDVIFKTVLYLSATGSIVCIFVMLIKFMFKNKLSPAWHYYIWLLVLLRLVLPYSISSPFSIFNVIPIAADNQATFESLHNPSEINQNYSDKNAKTTKEAQNTIASNSVLPYNTKPPLVKNIISVSSNWYKLYKNVLPYVWLIGMFVFMLYTMVAYIAFIMKIKHNQACTDPEIIDLLRECRQNMNVKTPVVVIYSYAVKSPCLLGIFKPKLLLPKKIVKQLSYNELKYIFLHELGHLKRKDILINWIVSFLHFIHWFNPILWISFKKMKQDCELSCDSLTLKHISSKEHHDYGETLIKLINIISKPKWEPWTAGIIGGKEIKRRIIMIAKYKKKRFFLPIVAVIITIAVCVIVLTNAKQKALVSDRPVISNTTDNTDTKTSDANNQTDNTANEASNTAVNSSTNNTSTPAKTNSANYAENNTSNAAVSNAAKNTSSSEDNITEKTKDYILNGQGNMSQAQKINWSETFLNQVDIKSLYSKYKAQGGAADDLPNFAKYITQNAPIQSNWEDMFKKDLNATYGEKVSKLEPLGDNLYQAYVIKNGSEVPFVVVSSRTGYYHG